MPAQRDDAEQKKLMPKILDGIEENHFNNELIGWINSGKLNPKALIFDDDFGQKSLYHLAVEKGNFELVCHLVANNLVDINQLSQGEPPRHALDFICNGIIEHKHEPIIDYLLSHEKLNIALLDQQGLNHLDPVLYHNNLGHLLLLLTSRQDILSTGNKLIQAELFRLKFGLDNAPSALSLILPYLQKNFSEFSEQSNNSTLSIISHIFSHNSIYETVLNQPLANANLADLVNKYNKGEMVLIHAGENGSPISYLLQKDTLYSCSGQSDNWGKKYRICEPKSIDKAIFNKLLHTAHPENILKLEFIQELNNKQSHIKNNSISSIQKSLYAMMFLLSEQKSLTQSVKNQALNATQQYIDWLTWDKLQQIDTFAKSYADNQELLTCVLKEARTQADNSEIVLEHLDDVIQNGVKKKRYKAK